jgi:beta-N-acetylhexosaminidase
MTPAGSLERLAASTIFGSFAGADVPDWVLRRIDEGLGGLCLFGSNLAGESGVEASARVAADLHNVRPSVLVALDEEGGAVTRLEAATGSSVPGNAALGAVDNPELTRQVAKALGDVLVDAGIDLNLAPCADVNVDVANPVIGVRSFGADPDLVGRHVVAFVQGLQAAGVSACVKHFPGHGATSVDSHLDLPEVDAPVELLQSRELTPFRAAIAAGAATVMTGHLRAPALDTKPATISRRILTNLLREAMGFQGAVVTDALDMRGIGGTEAMPANVVRALAAGADLCCLGSNATDELVCACVEAVAGALRSGALEEERLVDAAGRVASIPRLGHLVEADRGARGPSLGVLGYEAARRALRIDGPLPPLPGCAHVVQLRRAEMIAAGEVPWGVGDPLAQLDTASSSEWLDDPAGVGAALDRARDCPLVVVIRDPQTNPDTAAMLGALVEARSDAIVVDMGWPADDPPVKTRITTYGPSRASGMAVARLLVGMEPKLEIEERQH